MLKWRSSLVLLFILTCIGCQRSLPAPQTYPVNGKVLYNGKPMVLGLIEIEPKVPGKGANASGFIKEDGTFQLQSFGNDSPDGAVPGEYNATIKPWNIADASTGLKPKGVVPTVVPKTVKTTGIPIEIKAEENDLTIELK